MDSQSVKFEKNISNKSNFSNSFESLKNFQIENDTNKFNNKSIFLSVINTAFKITKILFFIIVPVVFLSNSYWVPEGTIAVHSRLGAISKQNNKAIRFPGGPYFAFPYPIDFIQKFPTKIRSVNINKSFFLEKDSLPKTNQNLTNASAFIPGIHGSLITGDKNIVQGKWTIHYRLNVSSSTTNSLYNVKNFVKNIGTIELTDDLIKKLAEKSIIELVAEMAVTDFVAGNFDSKKLQNSIQSQIDLLHSGIAVVNITSSYYGPPRVLEKDFQAATQAENEKGLNIEKAMRYRLTILNEIAGKEWKKILETIEIYENGIKSINSNIVNSTFDKIEKLLSSSGTGGYVASEIDKARTEKTITIEKARSSVLRFQKLYTSYKQNPDICKNQLFQETMLEVLSGPLVKVKYFPANTKFYLNDIEDNRNE